LRKEGEKRYFGPAIEADVRAYHSDASIGVLQHIAHLIEARVVLSAEIWELGRSDEREDHLPAMRVAGDLKVEAAGRGDYVREVRFMSQQNGGSVSRNFVYRLVKAILPFPNIIYASDCKKGAVAFYGKGRVIELDETGGRDHCAHFVRAGPMVVIAQGARDSIRRRELGDGVDYVAGEEVRVARKEIARNDNEIGGFCVDGGNYVLQVPAGGPAPGVQIADLGDSVAVEVGCETPQGQCHPADLYPRWLDIIPIPGASQAEHARSYSQAGGCFEESSSG